jgi:riboflavin synthase
VFTGIIQAVGRVTEVKPAGRSAQIAIDAGTLDLSDVSIGDSIACSGVCLTVVRLLPGGFAVDVSHETLNVAAGLMPGTAINLEKALRLADRLGGHLLSGHVDGRGEVTLVRPLDGNREVTVRFPPELRRYVARKGSIAVNGVSLTVNSVTDDAFCANLIPHTLAVTNLSKVKQGDEVNLEVDLVARYVETMLSGNRS